MYGVTNIVFIVFAGLGALLAAIPLPKAITSGNVGTSMLIVWTEVACFLVFANAIRWNGNIGNWAPFWCDFCSHFLIAVDVALVGSAVSINRRLYMIVTLDPRRHEKAFNVIVDTVLCLAIPLVSIALEYVVQQYRYIIYEDIGCVPGVGSVDLAFPLVWMLPLFVGTVSTGYACLTIRANFQRNSKVTGTSLAWSRRLMAISVISALYGLVPTSMPIILMATVFPVTAWPGWSAIHSTINDVIFISAQEWQSGSTMIACLELRRWTVTSLAYIIFLFLGLTEDVKKMYLLPFRSVVDHVVSSTDQAKCDLVGFDPESSYPTRSMTLGQHTDESSNDHWQEPRSENGSCTSFGKPPTENFSLVGLTDRPRLDLDLESV